jgi:hypothetical protein
MSPVIHRTKPIAVPGADGRIEIVQTARSPGAQAWLERHRGCERLHAVVMHVARRRVLHPAGGVSVLKGRAARTNGAGKGARQLAIVAACYARGFEQYLPEHHLPLNGDAAAFSGARGRAFESRRSARYKTGRAGRHSRSSSSKLIRGMHLAIPRTSHSQM